MKSPKIKFVVISAITLASIVGIFVFAQSPSPTSTMSGQDPPFHLVMHCAKVDKTKLKGALKPLPSPTYKFQYETEGGQTEDLGGALPPMTTPPPCSADKFNGNATQKATFANTKDLHDFLTAAGL